MALFGGYGISDEVFLQYRFGSEFTGYSFAEDLHLSTRVGKSYKLLHAPKARFHHRDLGQTTHRDWRKIGEMMFRGRHLVMTEVLGRRKLQDYLHLLLYECLYVPTAMIAGSKFERQRIGQALRLTAGKLSGFLSVVGIGKDPEKA